MVDEVESMLSERINVSDFCTLYITLKNGELKIAKVAYKSELDKERQSFSLPFSFARKSQ